jgi:Asp/Glu/hydantoin racemase
MIADAETMPTLFFIHTVPALADTFAALAARELPAWNHHAIVEEELLRCTLRDGEVSQATRQDLMRQVSAALERCADAIVVTCSTLGEATDSLVPLCPVPLFRIDEGMARAAVERGRRLGVLATLATTLGPTRRLLEREAGRAGAACTVTERLCAGAFESLAGGDRAEHDRRVIDGARALAASVDVIVLAQASMARALAGTDTGTPCLTSPELGMAHVAARLRGTETKQGEG